MYIHTIKMIKGLPIVTRKELIYGEHGVTIHGHVKFSHFIPYTSILMITTDQAY